MKKYVFLILIVSAAFIAGCSKQDENTLPPPEVLPDYDSTPYVLDYSYFPNPKIPLDNQLTIQKVQLGRMLFYEKKLSKGETQSCADCHLQVDGFSDIRQFSLGVDDLPGRRQAMPVFNMAWHTNGFFWDGRAPLLRDQALKPIQDPLEMNETLENAIAKLQETQEYRFQFARAFEDSTITSEKMGLAMEQFMNTILSMNSKYDQYLLGNATLSESEQRGHELFFTEFDPNGNTKGGECFHCHAGVNFTNSKFMNNGLDDEASFADLGYFETTANDSDKAKFKVPSLRNISATAPYMHDGRFATLDEVLNHYNQGVKNSSTVDEIMQYNISPGLQLTEQDKADIIAFLHTLTDETYLTNTEYSSPFK